MLRLVESGEVNFYCVLLVNNVFHVSHSISNLNCERHLCCHLSRNLTLYVMW